MSLTNRRTSLERTMLRTLQTHGVWMDRKDLARALKRGYLHSYHVRILERIVEMELIETRAVLIGGRIHYEYRALPPAANGV
jgi:hypothetical protein